MTLNQFNPIQRRLLSFLGLSLALALIMLLGTISPLQAQSDAPQVRFGAPLNGSQVLPDQEILIYGIASHAEGVTRLELYYNGGLVGAFDSPTQGGQSVLEALFTWVAPSEFTSHTLELIAYRGQTASPPTQLSLSVVSGAEEINLVASPPRFAPPFNAADPSCRLRADVNALPIFGAPSLESYFITTLAIGEQQPYLGKTSDENWREVTLGAYRGWVQAGYTTAYGTCENLPNSGDQAILATPTASDGANQAPTIAPIEPQSVAVGGAITVDFAATDPDNDSLAFQARPRDPSLAQISVIAPNLLSVSGLHNGATEVVVSIDDGRGGTAQETFMLSVGTGEIAALPTSVPAPTVAPQALAPTQAPPSSDPAPSTPPTIEAIPTQTLNVGETIIVPVNARTADGSQPFIANVESGAEQILQVAPDGAGGLRLTGISAGQVSVRLTIEDGAGLRTATIFQAVVVQTAPARNEPPIVDPIPTQTISVGESRIVSVNAIDPEGFQPFLETVQSGSSEIVRAQPDGQGNISLTGVSAGQVSVRVRVSDGETFTTLQFTVIVTPPTDDTSAPNQPPLVEAIPDQSLAVGESRSIPLNISDPEGFNPFIASVESGSPSIARGDTDGAGALLIEGVSPGQVGFRVTVSDGAGGLTVTQFNVVVTPLEAGADNQPAIIEAIPNQNIAQDETLMIPINARDPEGFRPFIAEVRSSSDEILRVSQNNDGTISITGVSPGSANVSVTVDDGTGVLSSTAFSVRIGSPPQAPPNLPPVIEPNPDQVLTIGQSVTVFITAYDPEGTNVFIADLRSSSDQIVTAERDSQGNILIEGVSQGQATVNFTIEDGDGQRASSAFSVSVNPLPTAPPNQPPVLEPMLDQVVGVGQRITVFITAYDPEGFIPFIGELRSSSDQIVAVERDGEGNVVVIGVSPGRATVTVIVDDGEGGQTEGTFEVLVPGAPDGLAPATSSAPPRLDPIPNQIMTIDTFLPLRIAGGEAYSLSISSSDERIVAAQITEGDLITLFGANLGQATITLTADDGAGGLASLVFGVTVIADGEGAVWESLPTLPILEGALLENIRSIHGFSDQDPARFIIVGDTPPAWLLGDAGDGFYDLSFDPTLADTLTGYLTQPAADGNILNRGGQASSNPDWRAADLLNLVNSPADCATIPLICEIQAQSPAVALIFLGRNDALNGTDPAAFALDLTRIVEATIEGGVIPVLTTLPGSPDLTTPYNDVIIGLAASYNLPLWNLAREITADQVGDDLLLSAPPEGERVLLTTEYLAYGANLRNLRLLQLLMGLQAVLP